MPELRTSNNWKPLSVVCSTTARHRHLLTTFLTTASSIYFSCTTSLIESTAHRKYAVLAFHTNKYKKPKQKQIRIIFPFSFLPSTMHTPRLPFVNVALIHFPFSYRMACNQSIENYYNCSYIGASFDIVLCQTLWLRFPCIWTDKRMKFALIFLKYLLKQIYWNEKLNVCLLLLLAPNLQFTQLKSNTKKWRRIWRMICIIQMNVFYKSQMKRKRTNFNQKIITFYLFIF